MSDRVHDLFTDTADEGARLGLLALMTGISEEFWAAGWMSGLEYSLWRAIEGGPRKYGMGELTDRQVALLKLLSEESGGWWIWDDGEKFVSLAEWEKVRNDLAKAGDA